MFLSTINIRVKIKSITTHLTFFHQSAFFGSKVFSSYLLAILLYTYPSRVEDWTLLPHRFILLVRWRRRVCVRMERVWRILKKKKSPAIKHERNRRIYLKLFGSYSRHTLWIFGIGCCWPEYPRFPFKNVYMMQTGPAPGGRCVAATTMSVAAEVWARAILARKRWQGLLLKSGQKKGTRGDGGHIVVWQYDFEVWQLQESARVLR